MSTYGYFKQDAMSDYAIAHHGIKGQKWGIRRFQNPDGSLTPEGRSRYGISDKEYSIAKKLYRGKGKYSIPLYTNLKSGSYEKAQKSVEAILKYDAMRSEAENGKNPGYFNAGRVGLNPIINNIHHYKDKNGKIALSYAQVPRIGEVYVKGSGDFNDLDLNKLFKKVPKGLQNSKKDIDKKASWQEPTKFYNGNKIDAKKTVSENIETFYKNGRKEKLAQEVLSKIKKDPNYGVSVHDIWDNTEAAVSKGLSDYLGLKSDNDKREIRFELAGSYDTYMDDITNLITKKIKDKGIDVY